MRKKGFSLCLAAITCVSLLAGCGEKAKESQTADNTSAVQTQEQEAADEQNGEVIQLKFTSWSAGGEQKAVKQALASFEEQNPGIKVEAEFIDNANYTAKINTLMAAGDAPNVAQLNGYLAPEYGAKPICIQRIKSGQSSAMKELKKQTNGGFRIGEMGKHIEMRLVGDFLDLDMTRKKKWDFLGPKHSHMWQRRNMHILKPMMTVHSGRQGNIL